MRRHLALVTVAAAVLAVPGCGSGDSGNTAPTAAPTTSVASSETESATTPLEGTWTTDLTRDAVVAYIRKAGWGKEAEKILLDPRMAGPDRTEFRIDFVGDRFRMAQAATDQQWQSGTFRIEDGRIYLDDEAPVGELTFRVSIDGDTATYDKPDDTTDDGDFVPGVPAWAPGAVMWASTPWERSDD
jgi:hypothetical protein